MFVTKRSLLVIALVASLLPLFAHALRSKSHSKASSAVSSFALMPESETAFLHVAESTSSEGQANNQVPHLKIMLLARLSCIPSKFSSAKK